MEPSGRNQWQPVANVQAPKTAETSQTVATGCDHLPFGAHGKEGVDGSSPSEGFTKGPANGFSLPRRHTYIARASLNLSPRSVPNISGAREFWLEQRRLTSSSTSVKERALRRSGFDLLTLRKRADEC